MTPTSTDKGGRTALFAGSFNPFTRGHADIVARGLEIFDRIVIGVGVNADKAGGTDCSAAIRELYADEPRVEVAVYSTLTADFAAELGASALLRGVRTVKDFEYERDLADINRQLSGIETVILFSRPEYAAISSSVVRELQCYGRDVSPFLPSK
ncbi:MAG: pantetheine-phosphate adenylyltransferase [Muribaculaceae bacterium]|nr:pantetheine-phosphate adenylyltransferase [Muribaculaceae bacterium]